MIIPNNIRECQNSHLYHLPRILHLLAKYRAEYHLNILDKGIMAVIITINLYLFMMKLYCLPPHASQASLLCISSKSRFTSSTLTYLLPFPFYDL